ncbi:hypothetical protein NDU88_000078, partial [Pleurodeles waltl]
STQKPGTELKQKQTRGMTCATFCGKNFKEIVSILHLYLDVAIKELGLHESWVSKLSVACFKRIV